MYNHMESLSYQKKEIKKQTNTQSLQKEEGERRETFSYEMEREKESKCS